MVCRRGFLRGAAGMVWWAAGNARRPLGPQAREAQRPDRRVLGTSRAGTGPAPSAGVIFATTVIVRGPSGALVGVFVYATGTVPGPGNGPIASMTNQTHDPFGNPVSPGISSMNNTFGTTAQLNGASLTMFAGVIKTVSLGPGGLSIFNSSGALVYAVDEARDASFLYADTGSSTQGALLASSASAAGTDSFGNSFLAGINEYVTISGTIWAVTLNQSVATFGGTRAGLVIQDVSSPFNVSPSVTGAVNGGGSELELSSGKIVAGSTQAAIQVRDSVTAGQAGGGVVINAGNFTAQTPTPNPVLLQVLKSTGQVQVILPDGNTYRTERAIQQVSPVSQTINSTTGQNVTGLSWPVIAGTYIVRARLIMEWNAAAGTPQMQFTGPAVSRYDVSFKTRQSGSSSTANTNSLVAAAAGNGTGYNSGLINQTQAMTAAGIFFDVDIWGMFTFTATGTLNLSAATTVAADTWIMLSGFWEVQPL